MYRIVDCTHLSNTVAIYCRLSEEDRDKADPNEDSGSIQNQKSMLIQYAISQGWDIYNIYSDDDYAGADRRRPEFNKLLADAEAKKFGIVLCKSQSRFTRELELVESIIHGRFARLGIRFVSLVDNADTANKGNKKSRQINGLVNEWFLEDMSDNIRSVLTNRRRNGFHIGSFALYGYMKDPDQKGHLIIDEEAAAVVREVFSLFSQGVGKTSIARILNDRGIPNPTEYKRQKGLHYMGPKGKTSTLWKYFAISDMLTNEIYIGNMVQGKYGSISYKTKECKPIPKEQWIRVEGTHEPIIDIELWNKVQRMITEKAKPCYNGQIGIFAKKLKCGYCGYTMRSGKKNDQYRYFVCSNRHVSSDACEGSFIGYDTLEKNIIGQIRKMSAEYLDMDELERRVEFDTNLKERKAKLERDLSAYSKRVEELTAGIKTLYLDKVKGLISESEFMEFSAGFKEDRARAEGAAKHIIEQLNELEQQFAQGDNRKAIIEKYVNLEDGLTREIVDALIDHIVVYRRIPGTKTTPIEIHWNF